MLSARTIQVMKRPRSSFSSNPKSQTLLRTRHSNPNSISTYYPSTKPKPKKTHSLKHSSKPYLSKWAPLHLPRDELCLPLTFPTGQTFRWKKTGPSQYTGVIGSHLVSLKHVEQEEQESCVLYCLHNADSDTNTNTDDATTALLDFLNASVSLSEIWKAFSDSDARFAELARHLGGARVLRQDPFECLIQFLCSSNNNIQRITKMVDYISSLGNYLGTVGGFEFHTFPTMDKLSLISEEELRKAGFGYRAKYIIGTVNALQSKVDGGEEWLKSLRMLDLQEVIDALSTLPGVGPKVAACVALFSLDQHHAIPVDTHVWRIATKYLLPELAGSRLTLKLSGRVAEAFVSKYGKYAGWAQTVLFIAELPSQKALLPSQLRTIKQHNRATKEDNEIEVE